MRSTSIYLLLIAAATACDAGVSPDLEPREGDGSTPVVDVAPAEADLNERPCGDRTIAVVTDTRNNQYIFCAAGDGQVEVLESIWEPARGEELTAQYDDVIELFRAVVPADTSIPDDIIAALRSGQPRVAGLFKSGERRDDFPRLLSSSLCSFSAFEDEYCESCSFCYWADFAAEVVDVGGIGYNELDCTSDVRVCNQSTWHQRTASSSFGDFPFEGDTPGGACASRERLISCDGSTLFNTWVRGGTSGAFEPRITNFWVVEDTMAVGRIFSNDAHSCADNADRDDMRFRADSEPGAYHNYSLIFIKYAHDLNPCEP